MLFDLYLQLQSTPPHEQQSAKKTNWIRNSIHRLRQSLIGGQKKAADEPVTSAVSRDLALSFLQSLEHSGAFSPTDQISARQAANTAFIDENGGGPGVRLRKRSEKRR